MDYSGRHKRLKALLAENKLDALLVTHLPNVRYLTGFTGSSGILLSGPRSLFFTDGRYREQAAQQVTGARVVVGKGSAQAGASEAVQKLRPKRVGIEADHMTVSARTALASQVGKGTTLVETSGLVEQLRSVKEPDEVTEIRNAVNLAAKLFRPLVRGIRPGVRESALAAKLEYLAKELGASGMSFETIVAGGSRSALPHGVASQYELPSRGFVVLDYGVILNGYCSDMTRTVRIGKAAREERHAYNAVLEAQLAAISAVRSGATAGDVDAAARGVLRRAKLDRYFTHSTGHGVGLEIHEVPRVASGQAQVLHPGMVITIEPGVYRPGKFGIRIEDMVLVTETGCEVLTPVTKDWIEV